MFKFLVLLTGLLLNNNHYQEVSEILDNEVLDERGAYLLTQAEDELLLSHRAASWVVSLPVAETYFSVLKADNYLYIYLTANGVYLNEYDAKGKELVSKELIKNTLEIEDVLYDEGLYLFGSIIDYQLEFLEAKKEGKAKADAIVLEFDSNYELQDFEIYGGVLDESFLKAVNYEEGFIVVGCKDPETGGDFGNGGRSNNNLFLARLDNDLALVDKVILTPNSKVLDLCYYKDFFYLATSNSLYKFSGNLQIINKKKFEEDFLVALIRDDNKYLFLNNNSIEVINILNFSSTSLSSALLSGALEIKVFPKALVVRTSLDSFKYDLISLTDFIDHQLYTPEVKTSRRAFGIFGEAELLEELSSPGFNPQIHGLYKIEYCFQTSEGIKFSVFKDKYVEMRVNVSNNNIYPLGYRLIFSGQAELDGKSVLNNQPLTEVGQHRLILTDYSNQKTEIIFYISRIQLSFQETADLEWDLEVVESEEFFLELRVDGFEGRQLKGIIIDGFQNNNLIFNQTKASLSIPLKAPNIVGIKYYYLEKLIYLEAGVELSHPINQIIKVNVLGNPLNLEITQVSELEYEIYLEDLNQTARYLEVIVFNNQEEYCVIYPLGTQNLIFEGLKADDYQVKINLIYDSGNRKAS
ncbi:MAG: hypothetical protein PHX62_05845, partial [Bacilli bacterium]|nr:hypothetical protein [Bacilli bacterium]